MGGHVDHVVGPAEHPQVPIMIHDRLIVGGVPARIPAEVGADVPVVVVPHGPGQGGEGLGHHQVALHPRGDRLACVVEHLVGVAGHGTSHRTGLEVIDAVHGVGPGRARLGLAVGVDDRHAATQVLAGPGERLPVERLTLSGDQAKVGQRVGGSQIVTELAQHPERGGGGQDLGDGVALAELVEARRCRRVQGSLVAGDGHGVGQTTHDRLDGERQPAHVGRHPVHVALVVADLPAGVRPRPQEEPADAVHHPLRTRLGPAGEDEE